MSLDLAAIEARAAAATAGPWTMPAEKVRQAVVQNDALMAVATLLHDDIPALLAAVRTLEAERDALRQSVGANVRRAQTAETNVQILEAELEASKRLQKLTENNEVAWMRKWDTAQAQVTALEEAAQAVVDVTHGNFTNLTHLDEKVRLLAAALLTKEGA